MRLLLLLCLHASLLTVSPHPTRSRCHGDGRHGDLRVKHVRLLIGIVAVVDPRTRLVVQALHLVVQVRITMQNSGESHQHQVIGIAIKCIRINQQQSSFNFWESGCHKKAGGRTRSYATNEKISSAFIIHTIWQWTPACFESLVGEKNKRKYAVEPCDQKW